MSMTETKSARRKQRTLTQNTKTTDSPSKFQVGDKIRFTDAAYPDWCGQEGVVMSNNDGGVEYIIKKAAPTELGPRWNTVGSLISNHEDQLTLIEAEKPAEEDVVNHPSHYTQYPVEVIEITRHLDFDRGNAVKYLARAGFKGGPEEELEDLKKAAWYVQDAIAQVEKKLSGLA